MISPLSTLADRWREKAQESRYWGGLTTAVVLERCADELLAFATEQDRELLTAEQAAAETGLKPSTIRAMWRDERLPNHGEPGRPRVRRGTLRSIRQEKPVLAMVRGALAERAAR